MSRNPLPNDPKPVYTTWPPTRPSDTWMHGGGSGFVDGAINPPVYYFLTAEKDAVYNYWAPRIPGFSTATRSPPTLDSVPSSTSSSRYPMPSTTVTASSSHYTYIVPSISSTVTTSASHANHPMPPRSSPFINYSDPSAVTSSHNHQPPSYSTSPPAYDSASTSTYSHAPTYVPTATDPGLASITNPGSLLPAEPPALIFLVQVNTRYQVSAAPGQIRVRSSAPPKTQTKSDGLTGKVAILTLDRDKFIIWCFVLHNLSGQYEPGQVNGPPFTIYWTGSAYVGGKGNQLLIKDDAQFRSALDELLRCNPNRANFRVMVEFDLDAMKGWETCERHADDHPATHRDSNFDEVQQGTQVSNVGQFSQQSQLVGHFIDLITKTYPCKEHKGEHREPGTCWKDANSKCLGLNNRTKKAWADEIVLGKATIAEPPNSQGIGTNRDGQPLLPYLHLHLLKPHINAVDLGHARVPVLAIIILGHACIPIPVIVVLVHAHDLLAAAATLRLLGNIGATGAVNLRECLESFKIVTGHDFLVLEEKLSDRAYTPDVIPDVGVDKLAEVTGCAEGLVMKFQKFCTDWVAKKERELRRRA
ncbi:hypothetical protein BT96DRAFT_993995 [Gymnopus androsaceus JB14]|uniref:Uncharacterized protein n=1 Tax=Gymnopus androsaceus JB14 TaxID=1447944 RepID=A0A6A4HNZ8_9AGAR|nr:hypothetical protein BT96DRAFT_993995 [Gymnopus androsaceus JB14]